MRLTGFRVNRYGVLADQAVEGLAPGICVFLGDNEAGKSTLLRFFQAMFFGFKRSGVFMDPVGDRKAGTGGLLQLETEAFGSLTLYNSPDLERGILRSTSGEEAPARAWERIFAGLTVEVFDSLFAFDLARLTGFAGKKGDPVRNALHGAAFGTGFISPAGVLKILDSRKKDILKERQSKAPLNLLLRELAETEAALAGAEPVAATWETAQRQLAETAEALRLSGLERDRLRAEEREAVRLVGALKLRADLRLLDAALKELEAEGPLPPAQAPDAAGRVAALEADLRHRKLEVAGLLSELEKQRAERHRLSVRPELAALVPVAESLRGQKEKIRDQARACRELAQSLAESAALRRDLLARLEPHGGPGEAAAPAALDDLARSEKALLEAEHLAAERRRACEDLLRPEPADRDDSLPDLPEPERAEALRTLLGRVEQALEDIPAGLPALERVRREEARALEALYPLSREALTSVGEEARGALAGALLEHERAASARAVAAAAAAAARRALNEAGADHDEARAARDALGPVEPEEAVRADLAGLRGLEAGLREMEAARRTGARLPSGLPLLLAACAVLGAALAGIGAFTGRNALLLLGAGLCLAGLAGWGVFAAGRARTGGELRRLEARLAEQAGKLRRPPASLEPATLQAALELRERDLRRQEDLRRAEADCDRSSRRQERLGREAERVGDRLEAARQALAESEAGGEVLLRGLGFPEGTPLRAAEGLFERLEVYQVRLTARQEVEAALNRSAGFLEACRSAARALPFFAGAVAVGAESEAVFSSTRPAPLAEEYSVMCRELRRAFERLDALRTEAAGRAVRLESDRLRREEAERVRQGLRRAEEVLQHRRVEWSDLLAGLGLAAGLGPEAARTVLALRRKHAEAVDKEREEQARREALAAGLKRFAKELAEAARAAGLNGAEPPADPVAAEAELLRLLDALCVAVDRAVADKRELGRLDGLIASREAALEEARAALELAGADLAALLRGAGVEDAESFRAALERRRRWEEIGRERLRPETELADMAGRRGLAPAAFLDFLAGLEPAEAEARARVVGEELLVAEERLRELAVAQGVQHERAEAVRRGDDTAARRQRLEDLRAEARELSLSWCVPALAKHFLEDARDEFQQKGQKGVVGHAGRIFASVTGGEYLGIAPKLEGDGFSFAARHKSGLELDPEKAMSRGAREQLYLALRLAFIQHHAEHAEALPVFMDDILVNFDPDRARNTARELARFARGNQILFFTCRPEQAELLLRAGRDESLPSALFRVCRGELRQMDSRIAPNAAASPTGRGV